MQHQGKRRRGVTTGTFLGCEVDGLLGFAGPRHRVGLLSACTALVAYRGSCTPDLLSVLLGCWVHVLMYRRPGLCILDASFSAALRQPRHQVFTLPGPVRNELLCIAVLGPLLRTDLRVAYHPELYALDASPFASGICSVQVGSAAVAELWRHCEQRGFYTRLEGPASALLRELGLDEDSGAGEVLGSRSVGPPAVLPRPLCEGLIWDVAVVFGACSAVAEAHRAAGLTVLEWEPCAPARLAPDLLDDCQFRELVALACREFVGDWLLHPPAMSFGALGRPRLRSAATPWGFAPSCRPTRQHNRLALRISFLCSPAGLQRHVPIGGFPSAGRLRGPYPALLLQLWFPVQAAGLASSQQALAPRTRRPLPLRLCRPTPCSSRQDVSGRPTGLR